MRAAKFSWVAYPKTTLLLQATTCRHYQLIHQESVEFDGTIDVKKDRRRSHRRRLSPHFDARTEARQPNGSEHRSTQKDPWPRQQSAPGQAACRGSARDK